MQEQIALRLGRSSGRRRNVIDHRGLRDRRKFSTLLDRKHAFLTRQTLEDLCDLVHRRSQRPEASYDRMHVLLGCCGHRRQPQANLAVDVAFETRDDFRWRRCGRQQMLFDCRARKNYNPKRHACLYYVIGTHALVYVMCGICILCIVTKRTNTFCFVKYCDLC